MELDNELYLLLCEVDTPTVCNAIEVAQGKRGFANFTRQTMHFAANGKKSMVGFARTAKIAAKSPPTETTDVIKQRRMDYYRYMSDAPSPSVVVIEDTDFPECVGAYWGEVNTSIHKGFGLTGALTNGVMRDLGDMAQGFPVLAGSIGPSHGFVHVKEFNTRVDVCGMSVAPGDLIHADQHGAVCVPDDVVPYLKEAISKLIQSEQLILGPTNDPDFDFEMFERAWQAFEKART